MHNPETSSDIEVLQQSINFKVEELLGDQEVILYSSELFESNSILRGVARTIVGKRFERRASLQLGDGHKWMTVTEYGTIRFGKSHVNGLYINGDSMADGEGRTTLRHWHIDLQGKTYDQAEYSLLDRLLDSERMDRDELFRQLAEYQNANPK